MGNCVSRQRDDSYTHADVELHPDLGTKPLNNAEQLEYSETEQKIKTGDLAVLYREGHDIPHFGVFIKPPKEDCDFPMLLVKGNTRPLSKKKFNPARGRDAHTKSAVNRIFYGDYKTVLVRHLETDEEFPVDKVMENVEKVKKIPFTDSEKEAIEKATTPVERSALVGALMIAHFYKLMPVLADPIFNGDPSQVTAQNLQEFLKLSDSIESIKLPPVKPGPLASGDHDPPLLYKILSVGIPPPPDVAVVPYDDIASTLNTGDIILMSGVTTAGALIKSFDRAQFSHVAIVLKIKHTTELMAWESNTNKTGLVDIESGKALQGAQLLPIRHQIYSGWNDLIAFRKLTGIDDKKRESMYRELLRFRKEVEGRPYEKNIFDLICSSADPQKIDFFRNNNEDLSSLFCSELVAAAYQRMGLLDRTKGSAEYTPDDFSSDRDSELKLISGRLEPEVYVELKLPEP